MKKLIFVLLFSSLAMAEQQMSSRSQKASRGIVITPIKTTYEEKLISSPSSSCSLNKFALLKQDYKDSSTENKNVGMNTGMYTFFETTDPSCNRDYAIVQFTKGCAIESYKDKVTKKWISYYMTYTLRGQDVDFNLPDWTVDTVDEDPMYASTDPSEYPDRHYWYATPKASVVLKESNKLKLFDYINYPSNGWALGTNQGPQQDVIFVSDYPSGSDTVYSNGAQLLQHDTVLDFKTCIYKRDDVPTTGNPKSFNVPADQGGPISCFDWSNNHIFNRTTKKFTQATDLKQFCTMSKAKIKN